jgi:hypothetical protein
MTLGSGVGPRQAASAFEVNPASGAAGVRGRSIEPGGRPFLAPWFGRSVRRGLRVPCARRPRQRQVGPGQAVRGSTANAVRGCPGHIATSVQLPRRVGCPSSGAHYPSTELRFAPPLRAFWGSTVPRLPLDAHSPDLRPDRRCVVLDVDLRLDGTGPRYLPPSCRRPDPRHLLADDLDWRTCPGSQRPAFTRPEPPLWKNRDTTGNADGAQQVCIGRDGQPWLGAC